MSHCLVLSSQEIGGRSVVVTQHDRIGIYPVLPVSVFGIWSADWIKGGDQAEGRGGV